MWRCPQPVLLLPSGVSRGAPQESLQGTPRGAETPQAAPGRLLLAPAACPALLRAGPAGTSSTGELRRTAPSFRAASDLGAPPRSPLTSRGSPVRGEGSCSRAAGGRAERRKAGQLPLSDSPGKLPGGHLAPSPPARAPGAGRALGPSSSPAALPTAGPCQLLVPGFQNYYTFFF